MQYKLSKEIQFGSETISEVTIKEEYDAGDMARILNAKKKGDGDLFLEAICIGTGFPLPKASKIPTKDSIRISTIVYDFLGVGEE